MTERKRKRARGMSGYQSGNRLMLIVAVVRLCVCVSYHWGMEDSVIVPFFILLLSPLFLFYPFLCPLLLSYYFLRSFPFLSIISPYSYTFLSSLHCPLSSFPFLPFPFLSSLSTPILPFLSAFISFLLP